MKILAIDDMKERHSAIDALHPLDEIYHVYNVEQAAIWCMQPFDLVYLDHDAGLFEYFSIPEDPAAKNIKYHFSSFWPCACILALNPKVGQIRIHSMNKEGAERMYKLLKEHGKDVVFANVYDGGTTSPDKWGYGED